MVKSLFFSLSLEIQNELLFDYFFVCSEDQCKEAFLMFNGRWYAGRQLQCEFSPVTKWKTAICGKCSFLLRLRKKKSMLARFLFKLCHSISSYRQIDLEDLNSDLNDLVKICRIFFLLN